jgi:hypothetical protein
MRDVNQFRIQTKHPEGKLGISIDKETYTLVSDYIFTTLKKDEASTLSMLIDRAAEYFPSRFNNWTLNSYLFWIKLDLEAKGIIKSVCNKKNGKGLQSFKLTRKWMHKNSSTLQALLTC